MAILCSLFCQVRILCFLKGYFSFELIYISNIIGVFFPFFFNVWKKWLCDFVFCDFSFVCDGIDGWAARKFNQGMVFSFPVFLLFNMWIIKVVIQVWMQIHLVITQVESA